MNRKQWSSAELEILANHYGKSPYTLVMSLLPGRTTTQICQKARYIGLKGNLSLAQTTRRTGYRKHTFNYNFFSPPHTAIGCYWAGFIAADGCINEGKPPKISITVGIKDIEHLELFCSDISFTGAVRRDIASCQTSSNITVARLSLSCSGPVISDLEKSFSITPRKSKSLKPPNLAIPELAWPFIIGYIDGDGSISKQANGSLPILGLRGTSHMLEWVRSWIDKTIPSERPCGIYSEPRGYLKLQLYGKRTQQLANVVLKLSPRRLGRKWSLIAKI